MIDIVAHRPSWRIKFQELGAAHSGRRPAAREHSCTPSAKPNQRYALLFRDYLASHPWVAAAYGELKVRLAASLASEDDDPDVKDPAVDLIYFAAEEWASGCQWQPQASDA